MWIRDKRVSWVWGSNRGWKGGVDIYTCIFGNKFLWKKYSLDLIYNSEWFKFVRFIKGFASFLFRNRVPP